MESPSEENQRSRSPTKGRNAKHNKNSKQRETYVSSDDKRSESSRSSRSYDRRDGRKKQYDRDRSSSERHSSQKNSSDGPQNNNTPNQFPSFQGLGSALKLISSVQGDFPGSVSQRNFKESPLASYPGSGPQKHFQRTSPQDNIPRLCPQINFQGSATQANTRGPGPQGRSQPSGFQGIRNNFAGSFPQGCFPGQNFQENLNGPGQQGNFQGPGPQVNFQGPGPQGNFQGLGPQGNFQGPGPQGNFQGPGPQGNFQAPGPQGNLQGPAIQENFLGLPHQGNFKGPGNQENFQAPVQVNFQGQVPIPPGSFQLPGPQGNFQGPCPQGNFQGSEPHLNFQGPNSQLNFQGPNSQMNYQGPCQQSSLPLVPSQPTNSQHIGPPINNYTNYPGTSTSNVYQNYPENYHQFKSECTIQPGNSANVAPMIYQQNSQQNDSSAVDVNNSVPSSGFQPNSYLMPCYSPNIPVADSNISRAIGPDTFLSSMNTSVLDIPEPVLPPLPKSLPSSNDKNTSSFVVPAIDIALPPHPPKPLKLKDKKKDKETKQNLTSTLQSSSERKSGIEVTVDKVKDLNSIHSIELCNLEAQTHRSKKNFDNEKEKSSSAENIDCKKNEANEIKETDRDIIGQVAVVEQVKSDEVNETMKNKITVALNEKDGNEKCMDSKDIGDDEGRNILLQGKKGLVQAVKTQKSKSGMSSKLDYLAKVPVGMEAQQINATDDSHRTNPSTSNQTELPSASLIHKVPVGMKAQQINTTNDSHRTIPSTSDRTELPSTSLIHDKSPNAPSNLTKKLNLPCLGIEAAKKRLKSFSTSNIKKESKSLKTIALQPPQQQDESANNDMKPLTTQKEMLDEEKNKKKKEKRKEKVFCIEQIKEEETRIKEVLNFASPNNSFKLGLSMVEISSLFDNPEALRKFEKRGKDFKEKLERGDFSSDSPSKNVSKKNRERSRTPKRESNRQNLSSSKSTRNDNDERRKESKSSLIKSSEDEYVKNSNKSTSSEEKKFREEKVEKKGRDEKKKMSSLKNSSDCGSKSIQKLKRLKSWKDLIDINMTLDEFHTLAKRKNNYSHSDDRSCSRSPVRSRRDSGTSNSRKSRSSSRDRSSQMSKKDISPFPHFPKQFETVKVGNARNYDTKELRGSFVQHTLTYPSITYSVFPGKLQVHYWNRRELKLKNKFNPEVLDIVEDFWDIKSNTITPTDERPECKNPWYVEDLMSSDYSTDEDEKGKSVKEVTALDYLSSSYKADTALQMFEKKMEAADTLIEKLKSRESRENLLKTSTPDAAALPQPPTSYEKRKKQILDSQSQDSAPNIDAAMDEINVNELGDNCSKVGSQHLNEEYETFINGLELKSEEALSLSDDNTEFNVSLLSFDDTLGPMKEESDKETPLNPQNEKKERVKEPNTRKEIKKLLMNPKLSKKERKRLKRLKKNLKKEKRDKRKQKKELKKQRKAEKKQKKKQEKMMVQELNLTDKHMEPVLPTHGDVDLHEKHITNEMVDYEVVDWEEYDDEGTVREHATKGAVGKDHGTNSGDNHYQNYQAEEENEVYEPSELSYNDKPSEFYEKTHSSQSVSSLSSLSPTDDGSSYSDITDQTCEVNERYSPGNMSVCSIDSADNAQVYSPSQVEISSPYPSPSTKQVDGNLKNFTRSPSPYSPSSPQSSSNSDAPEDTDVKENIPSLLDTIPMPPPEPTSNSSHEFEEKQFSSIIEEKASKSTKSEENLVPLQKAFQPVTFRLGSIKQSVGFKLLQKAPLPGFSEEGEEEDRRSLASSALGRKTQKLSLPVTDITKTDKPAEEPSNVSHSKENEPSQWETEKSWTEEDGNKSSIRSRSESSLPRNTKENEESIQKTEENRTEEDLDKSYIRSRSDSTSSRKEKKKDKRNRSHSPVSKWSRIKSPPPKKYRDKSPDLEYHQKEKHKERKHSRTRSKSGSKQESVCEDEAKKSAEHLQSDANVTHQELSDSTPRPINSISNLFNQEPNQNESWDWAGPGNEAPMGDHATKSVSPEGSPKRMSLNERLKQEHGVEIEEETVPSQALYPSAQGGYYWEYNPPPSLPHMQVPAVQTGSAKPQVIRVGNVLQVLPQDSPEKPVQEPLYDQEKEHAPRMVQTGNVIQVVPTNYEDAASGNVASETNAPVEVAPVPPPTQNPLALISSLLASSISQPASASQGIASSVVEPSGKVVEPSSLTANAREKETNPAPLDSEQKQAILSAVAAAAASGVTASNLPIAHLISVLQQQNLLTQSSAAPSATDQAPESSLTSVSSSEDTKGKPPQIDLESFKQQRRERKERKRKEREQRRKARKQKALIKKLELEAKLQPALTESLDEEDTIYKEAISEVPELGSPIPDYETFNDDEFGDEDEDQGKKPPFVPLPDPPEKGILIEASNSYKILRSKDRKSVSFADGVMPGYGTSPSGGEEIHSPPPPSAKAEKKEKKQKVRKKKKVKVRMIKQYLLGDSRMDSPPPPPDSPPTAEVLKLYPGCTHYTCTAPGTFVIYTQQAVRMEGRTTDLQLASGSAVTIPPGMLIHSSALSKSFVPGNAGDKMDTSLPPSMPITYPGYAIPPYYGVSAPTNLQTGVVGSNLLQESPLA